MYNCNQIWLGVYLLVVATTHFLKNVKKEPVFIVFSKSRIWRRQKQPSRGVLKKRVLKICSKFTGEHPCQSVVSIKLLLKKRWLVNIKRENINKNPKLCHQHFFIDKRFRSEFGIEVIGSHNLGSCKNPYRWVENKKLT